MSQLISATSPLPRAPAARAEPSVEPGGESPVADGFAALLAGLFASPVAAPPVVEPAKPALVKGEVPIEALPQEAMPDDTVADQGTAGRQAAGANVEQPPLGGDAAALPIATPGKIADGTAPLGDAEAAVAMPQRAGADTRAGQPPAGGERAPQPSGEVKAAPATSGPIPAAPAPPAIERRHGDLRATNERAPAPVAASRDGGEAAGGRTAAGTAQPAAPIDQRVALSPIPSYVRLGLAWQADLADLGAGAPSTGLAGADGIAASVERSAVAIADQAAGGTARPVQQIALAIERAVNGELRQLTIQLSPRELGTIEIAIELDADRRLTVAILAERPETLDLLRQDSRQLERLLGQHGVNLADAGLEFGLMSQERREGRERPLPAALDQARADEAEGHGESGPAPPTPSLGSAQRLNISI